MRKTASNLSLIIWVEDDNDIVRDKHNGESEKAVIPISISKSPQIVSVCPKSSFGVNDSYPLDMEIRDETNGKVVVYLDGKLVKEIPYNATIVENGLTIDRINTSCLLPNDLSRTEHKIDYYPIDEFGFEATPVWMKNCTFTYKSRPILKDLKLNRTKIDNDEPVSITGWVTDYDKDKVIYIMQRIADQSPIPIGNITSNGNSRVFIRIG